jgi:hypothetical protein
MATTETQRQRSTDPRPTYFQLGIDERDARHVADTGTETIHVIHADGSRDRYLLNAGTIDDYMATVADVHGWSRRDYGIGFAEMLDRSIDA